MYLITPSFEILTPIDGNRILADIERAGRTCYKSEAKITPDSAVEFCRKLLKMKHLSVIEHESVSVLFVIDRGVSHELVRHRLCSFSQESTRYCNYKGGVTFVIPPWCKQLATGEWSRTEILRLWRTYFNGTVAGKWLLAMARSESSYLDLLGCGWPSQQARSVLPNSLKTEITVTANLREWRHIFSLRCAEAAHPQMREVMIPLRQAFREAIPVLFDDCNDS